MQKFVLKSSAALMLAGIAQSAYALSPAATTPAQNVYASEMFVSTATSAANDHFNSPASDVAGILGFGVSNGQRRFIRIDITNGTFDTAVPTGLTGILEVGAVPGDATETLVSGGAAGTSSVIFEITAVNAAGLPPTSVVDFNVSSAIGIRPTFPVGAAVTLTYRLFETAEGAVSVGDATPGNDATPLFTSSGTLASFQSGLLFTIAPNTTTIEVATDYKNFSRDNTLLFDGFVSGTEAAVGTLTYGAAANVFDPRGAAADPVLLSDLVTTNPGSIVVTAADYSTLTEFALDTTPGAPLCNSSDIPANANPPVATERTFALANPQTGLVAGTAACFNVAALPNTRPRIVEQNFSVRLNITPAPNTTTTAPAATLLGNFVRNGTVLKVPYLFNNRSGIVNFVHLSNSSTLPATYTVECIANGQAPAPGLPGTIPAGRSISLDRAAIGCGGAFNTAIFTINAVSGTVIGSMVRTSTSSGESGFDAAIGSE